jgi:hypothetical protein
VPDDANVLSFVSWCYVQHLSNLLAAPVPEVAAAALQTFQVLVRKTHHTSVRWTAPAGLSQRLLSLSKGWGGKEEVRSATAAKIIAAAKACLAPV